MSIGDRAVKKKSGRLDAPAAPDLRR